MTEKARSWIALNLIRGLEPVKLRNLISRFGSPEGVLNACVDELLEVEGIDKVLARDIIKCDKSPELTREMYLIKKHDVRIITIDDKEYPLNLKFTFNPPLVLYVKGGLIPDDNVSIAIVGSRKATDYGKAITEKLTGELAKNNITVVSGLARGIDTYAHKGTLAKGARTIAVLGSGLGFIYPPENRVLAEEIAKNGAVISEFPMTTRPEKANFPRRNRLISGLSLGTVVIEAAQKSGSLITAAYALEQGRDVFAVPGSIYSDYSKGTHKLIKQGAKLTENINDIIEEIDSFKEVFLDSKI